MKCLHLQDLLRHIGGLVIHGSENILIENVVTKPYELVQDHTLLFHFDHKEKDSLRFFQPYHSCVLVTETQLDLTPLGHHLTVVRVANIRMAFRRFIRYYRSLFTIPVIGVTGTCGKTTTKEMIRHILMERFNTHSTYLSDNALSSNLHYLLGIDDQTQAAIFEMGVSSPGNLKQSCKYFQPTIGIITTIGIDHLVGCKTVETYIKAKNEIVDWMSTAGTLILNADNENTKKLAIDSFQGNILYFGFSEQAHFRASDMRYTVAGMEFLLHCQDQIELLLIPGYGRHNVLNALAAITAAHTLGIPFQEAGKRLTSFQHVERHLEVYSGIEGSTIIDDTWSSNPTSVESALEVLSNVAQGRKSIAIIGKMSLLGKSTRSWHAAIGQKVVEAGVDILITIGSEAEETGRKALDLGMNGNQIFFCKNRTQFMQILQEVINEESVVLLKTSAEDAYLRRFLK